MNNSRLEWKVGVFLIVSLTVTAALIMKFSKSSSFFTKTYELLLTTSNVGGIRPGATVLMAGVAVGTVRAITLSESGKIVTMHTPIESQYRIHRDARFTIEQAGFLGDQYIAVTPGANQAPILQDGDTVPCQEPFNLQEVARSAAGLIQRVDLTAAKLNEAVARIDRTLLSHHTLTNASAAVVNFRIASERALNTLHGVDELIETNTPPLTTVISNLVHFTEQLDQVTEELRLTVATNRIEITTAIQNFQAGTLHLSGLLNDLQAGRGLAGTLLKDDQLQQQFSVMMSNLSILSSNLSRDGLFWRPRVRRAPSDLYPGKDPTR